MNIVGKRVQLRAERRATDAEDLFRWLQLEEWQYNDEPHKPFQLVSREAFDEWQQRPELPRFGSGQWQVDTLKGEHIGWVIYYGLDVQARSAYVGIDLPEPETWGRGYGAEALRLLIGHEKCGFKETARLPHYAPVSVRGEPLERVEFTIRRSEWA